MSPAANPSGFLQVQRAKLPKRAPDTRVHDNTDVYLRLDEHDMRAQTARCMDCGVPFCHTRCPLHNIIPEWNERYATNDARAALDRLHFTNNFPEFTGAICPAPCEDACVLTVNDEPVHIRETELTLAELGWQYGWITPQPPAVERTTRVAVIGSGPAGLACAQQLRRNGHQVDVYEKSPFPGGLLRFGIPDFKLEKYIVERRVAQLAEEGVRFHCGTEVDATSLCAQADAVVVATGAQRHRVLGVPGEDAHGVLMAMEYLTAHNNAVQRARTERVGATDDASPDAQLHAQPHPDTLHDAHGKHVVIVGGGDTGADCLGIAHRQGAASCTIITHGIEPPHERPRAAWPEVPKMLRLWPSHEEGGTRLFAQIVQRFVVDDNGNLTGVEVTDATQSSAQPAAQPATHTLPADLVCIAIGFARPRHVYEEKNIFVAGDARTGAALIVTAIADGRRAAEDVEAYLLPL